MGSGLRSLSTLSLHPASAFFHLWGGDFTFFEWFSPSSLPITIPFEATPSLGRIIPVHFTDLRLCFSCALSSPPRRKGAGWVPD